MKKITNITLIIFTIIQSKKRSAWPYSSIHRSIKKGVMEEDWAQEDNSNDGSYGE